MINIQKAQLEDLQEILKLQKIAYQSEAQIHNDFTIQPLTQTLDQVIEEFHKGVILKAVKDGVIVGSVRASFTVKHSADKNENTVCIGKLMVDPKHQGNGMGRQLLAAIEKEFSGCRFELYTACKSNRNMHLYETSGYVRFKEETDEAGIRFAFFEKNNL